MKTSSQRVHDGTDFGGVTDVRIVLRQWWQTLRNRAFVLLIVLVTLVVVRLLMPFAIKEYVNRQLQKATDYTGTIGAVQVQLWRGAYRIQEVRIYKRSGKIQKPFFSARTLDLSVQWKELFHGEVVGEIEMLQPQLYFVAGPTESETQTGQDARWDQMLKSLFPFKLNRLLIEAGEVHFANEQATPPVDIFISELAVVVTNLTNARNLKQELPAGLIAHGNTLGQGRVHLQLQLNPLAESPFFELSCQLSNVNLVSLNEFLLAYGKFEVKQGKFSLYTSVAAKDGNYVGYFKPFFENLDVFNWQREKNKGVIKVVWQAIVGALTTVFKNQYEDSLATRIPISGSYEGNEVGTWTAAFNLLRNAFVQALVPRVDEQVSVQEAAPDR